MALSSPVITLPSVVQCPPPRALPMLSAARRRVPNQVFFPKRRPTSFRLPALSLTLHTNTMKTYHLVPKKRGPYSICSFYNPLPKEPKEESNKSSSRHSKGNKLKFWVSPLSLPVPVTEETETGGLDWRILKRWDVPWQWQIVPLFMFADEITCFVLPGFLPSAALSTSFLETQRLIFLDFAYDVIYAAIVHGVIYYFKSRSFQPLPDDIFCYDPKKPFSLQKGWLLWAGLGFASKCFAHMLPIAIMMPFFRANGEQTSLDSLPFWEPYMGTSCTSRSSIAFIVGQIAVLSPMLEEVVYRGFLMVSLTKWFPTPISVLLSAAVFAIAHRDPIRLPELFLSGIIYGFSYAQTRNLLTPITMHVLHNSLVVLMDALIFLR